jgi:hypothetical protein
MNMKIVRMSLLAAIVATGLFAAKPSSAMVMMTPMGPMGNICLTAWGPFMINWAYVGTACWVATPSGPVYGTVANY